MAREDGGESVEAQDGHRRRIFIDALHEEAQCLWDVENALKRLSANGCIVVHDTNPPTEWHQRPAGHYRLGRDGTALSGTLSSAFATPTPDVAVVTFDVDWGCGIIRRRPTPRPIPILTPQLTWAALENHRDRFLNLRPATWAELHKSTEDSRADAEVFDQPPGRGVEAATAERKSLWTCRYKLILAAMATVSAAWSRTRNDAVTAYSQAYEMDVATLEILVLRAWLESGGKPRLRVRLVTVIPGQAERQVLSTTSVEDACEAVRSWLTALEPEGGPSAP